MFGKGVQVHLKEIHRELTVDVVELVSVFAAAFIQVLLVDLFEVVQVIRAFGVHAFVEDEVLPILFGNQGVAAVGTAQLHGRETAVLW